MEIAQSSRKHEDLLSAILDLNVQQRVASPKRRELSFHISEFDLSQTEKVGAQESKLMKTVWQKQRLGENDAISKTLKVKVLDRALQGPAATRVQRTVGFEKLKNRLNSWNTVVQSNRNAEELRFPLNQSTVSWPSTDDVILNWKSQTQTPLEQQMSAILNESPAAKQDGQEKKQHQLNLKELGEYRKEMAKMRALQSYVAAKAKRQKKIKSKRYHRILRSECTKKQLKEFEALSKVDPEAALKQIEKLERARVQERASLRHRNTGRWAHNKAVRAKYDVESRKTLVQQLEISRLLTQKNKMGSSSEEEEEEEETKKHEMSCSNDNPWTGMEEVARVGTFVSNYHKYWQQKNHSMEKSNNTKQFHQLQTQMEKMIKMHSLKQCAFSKCQDDNEVVNIRTSESQTDDLNNLSTKVFNDYSKKCTVITAASGIWIVTPTTKVIEGVDDVNLNTSNKMEQKLSIKGTRRMSSSTRMCSIVTVVDSDDEMDKLPVRSKAFVDEQLSEEAHGRTMDKNLKDDHINKLYGVSEREKGDIEENGEYCNVDPNKVLMLKPKNLVMQLPEEIANDDENVDNESDEENQMNITEAFTEDDVIAEFRKEKETSQATDIIGLTLPGWGEWTGKDIKCSRKKRRSLIIKAPRLKPKNFNNGNVVINDQKDEKVHQHQVNELPLAFTSIKDFEASIRAPLGITWIPHTAHHKLTAPSVVTKLGTTVKPLDQDVLVNSTKLNKIQ